MGDTDSGPSLHDALSAAIDTHEAPEVAPVVVEATPEAPEAPTEGTTEEAAPATDRTRDEKGRFAQRGPDSGKATPSATSQRAETGATPSPPGAETPVSATATPVVQASNATTPPPDPELRAPAAWKALSREHWGKVPPEIQRELVKREHEVNTRLQQDAEARNGFQMFQRVVGPYEGLIRARGAEPLAVVDNAVRAYVGLHTSPPQVQAQMVANMVRGLNIPIDVLDAALVGEVSRTPPPQQQFDPARFKQELKEDFERERLVGEVAAWSQGKEFIDDVRDTMQGLLMAAAQRGQQMTLDQAYERACRADPDIAAVVDQRKAADAAKAQAQKVAQVRNAASSVTPRPAVHMNGEGPKGLRDYLEAAIEVHSGR